MSVYDVALTGIQSSIAGFSVAAQNVANVNTPGYRSQRYDAASGTTQSANNAPASQPDTAVEQESSSDVDLVNEFVGMATYELGLRANAAVLHAVDRTQQYVLDILA